MPVLKPIKSPRGFTIIPVHYSHDPERSHPEWKVEERKKYASDAEWNQEQEIDFRAIVGDAAYPSWSDGIHIDDRVVLNPQLPLCIACDFNVNPCNWVICQILHGQHLHAIDEISLGPTLIEKMVQELRNRYPAHPAPIVFYGDATGKALNVQTNMASWDLVKIHMGTYPVPVDYRVPVDNPDVKDRLGAVNFRLRDNNGRAWIHVHPRCVELIADFQEVVLTDDGKKEKQVRDRDNPYHRRTHAASALGYLVYREWPLISAVSRASQRQSSRPPPRYEKILGEI